MNNTLRIPSQSDTAQSLRPVLNDLIDLGIALARDVEAQMAAMPTTAPGADRVAMIERTTTMFVRASRAVRCSIILAQSRAGRSASDAGASLSKANRKRLIRAVENNIHLYANEALEDAVHDEMEDWLDSIDAEEEIDDDTIAEVVAVICRDLGLANAPGRQTWRRHAPKDITDLCARAARPWSTIPPV